MHLAGGFDGRYVVFQLAEVAVPQALFAAVPTAPRRQWVVPGLALGSAAAGAPAAASPGTAGRMCA